MAGKPKYESIEQMLELAEADYQAIIAKLPEREPVDLTSVESIRASRKQAAPHPYSGLALRSILQPLIRKDHPARTSVRQFYQYDETTNKEYPSLVNDTENLLREDSPERKMLVLGLYMRDHHLLQKIAEADTGLISTDDYEGLQAFIGNVSAVRIQITPDGQELSLSQFAQAPILDRVRFSMISEQIGTTQDPQVVTDNTTMNLEHAPHFPYMLSRQLHEIYNQYSNASSYSRLKLKQIQEKYSKIAPKRQTLFYDLARVASTNALSSLAAVDTMQEEFSDLIVNDPELIPRDISQRVIAYSKSTTPARTKFLLSLTGDFEDKQPPVKSFRKFHLNPHPLPQAMAQAARRLTGPEILDETDLPDISQPEPFTDFETDPIASFQEAHLRTRPLLEGSYRTGRMSKKQKNNPLGIDVSPSDLGENSLNRPEELFLSWTPNNARYSFSADYGDPERPFNWELDGESGHLEDWSYIHDPISPTEPSTIDLRTQVILASRNTLLAISNRLEAAQEVQTTKTPTKPKIHHRDPIYQLRKTAKKEKMDESTEPNTDQPSDNTSDRETIISITLPEDLSTMPGAKNMPRNILQRIQDVVERYLTTGVGDIEPLTYAKTKCYRLRVGMKIRVIIDDGGNIMQVGSREDMVTYYEKLKQRSHK